MPRRKIAAAAPISPVGTIAITASGSVQLSYSATRHRKINSSDSANSHGACVPVCSCSKARPVQRTSYSGPSSRTSSASRVMAAPVVWPGATSALMRTELKPSKRSSVTSPRPHSSEANAASDTIAPCALRTCTRASWSGCMRNGASACRITRRTRPSRATSSI
ncbi:hypothetical protein D3C72_1324360 [compost metagenome]